MIRKLTGAAMALAAITAIAPVRAETGDSLSIPLSTSTDIQRQTVAYTCKAKKGASSAKLRAVLPEKIVKVSYINAGDISLAVLRIDGKTQIFTNVIAASGAKYAAAEYVWWSKGDDAMFSSEMDASAMLTCHEIKG
ncbi:MliC family protein [Asaia platycodi]|uniref:MliC family protein n=1 Tax=Asaia platycodi TaxID=610243 RepID=UPI0004721F00|nr:MliC family protein [Asaia platycodi]